MATPTLRLPGESRGTVPTGQPQPLQPGEFTPATTAPPFPFATTHINPPSPQWVSTDDQLQLAVVNSFTGASITLSGRYLTPFGEVKIFSFTVLPVSTRVLSNFNFQIGPCFLISAQVSSATGTQKRGQTFCSLLLGRGPAPIFFPTTVLVSDYLAGGSSIGWPGGVIWQSVEGPGFMRTILGGTPAPGVNINELVPTGARWSLRGARASLTTSATVINREAFLLLDDGTNAFFVSPSGFTQVASLTRFYDWGPGVTRWDGTQTTETAAPIPETRLMVGYRIRAVVTNLQVGDQWSGLSYEVEEWLEV